jgi:hypothetical protein
MDEPPALDPRDEGSINEAIGSARDPSRADLSNEGVTPARERDDRLAAIRAAVERSLEDVKAGRVADQDAALDRIEKMLDEIEAAKKA